MTTTARGCELNVERGPNCLFIRPRGASLVGHEHELADQIWALLELSLTDRVVLELDDVGLLHSSVIAQLLMLQKRVQAQGGLMRICGLSPANQRVLATCRLQGFLPQYCNRTEAVMGTRPSRPR